MYALDPNPRCYQVVPPANTQVGQIIHVAVDEVLLTIKVPEGWVEGRLSGQWRSVDSSDSQEPQCFLRHITSCHRRGVVGIEQQGGRLASPGCCMNEWQ